MASMQTGELPVVAMQSLPSVKTFISSTYDSNSGVYSAIMYDQRKPIFQFHVSVLLLLIPIVRS